MENNFKDIYEKIYNENEIQKIEKMYRKRSKNILIFFGITMLLVFIIPVSLFITIPAMIVYVIITSSKKQLEKENEYITMYKEKLVLPLLQEIFPNSQYRPNDSLALEKYLEAEYKDNFVKVEDIGKYTSNDHIYLPLDVNGKEVGYLDVYDVKLETHKTSGSSSSSNRLTIFEGLTATITLPRNICSKIKVSPKVISNFIDTSKDNGIATNFPAFDTYYTITSDQEVVASQIFTMEVMQKILDIFNKYKQIYTINIINNRLYVRASCFETFEPVAVIGNNKHMHQEKSFNALKVIKEATSLIYEVIDNTDI